MESKKMAGVPLNIHTLVICWKTVDYFLPAALKNKTWQIRIPRNQPGFLSFRGSFPPSFIHGRKGYLAPYSTRWIRLSKVKPGCLYLTAGGHGRKKSRGFKCWMPCVLQDHYPQDIWMFPKIVRFSTPNHPFLIGFSIIFTIHFGVSLFLETPIYRLKLKTSQDRLKIVCV